MANKDYKVSLYNVLLDSDSEKYRKFLWNTSTGTVIGLTEDGLSAYNEFCGRTRNAFSIVREDIGEKMIGYFDTLLSNGFIVDMDLNEFEMIKLKKYMYLNDPNPDAIKLTIATTLLCNYNCKYCFEKNAIHNAKHVHMTEQVADAIFEYVKVRYANNPNIKKLKVTWFGGEPMLSTNIIRYLSTKLIGFCDDKGISYTAGMISNGRRLLSFDDDKVKSFFDDCRIGSVQVSIDGPHGYYEEVKGATSEDLDIVLESVTKLAKNTIGLKKRVRVTVRINLPTPVSPSPRLVTVAWRDDAILQARILTAVLMEDFGLDGLIRVYLGFTRVPFGDQEEMHRQFLQLDNKFMDWFIENGFNPKSLVINNYDPAIAGCGNVALGNLTISPDGSITQCEHYVGDSDNVSGNIMNIYNEGNTGMIYTRNTERYINAVNILEHGMTNQEMGHCEMCPIYPICHGGCPDDILKYGNIIACDQYTKNIYKRKQFVLQLKHGGDAHG